MDIPPREWQLNFRGPEGGKRHAVAGVETQSKMQTVNGLKFQPLPDNLEHPYPD